MSIVKKKMQQKKGAMPQPIHANNSFFHFMLYVYFVFSFDFWLQLQHPSDAPEQLFACGQPMHFCPDLFALTI